MTTPQTPKISLRSENDLLAAIPYLVGWNPTDSLIVVALSDKLVVFTARIDLPPAGPTPPAALDAINVIADRAGQKATSAILVGYGEPDRVDPIIDSTLTAMEVRLVPVPQALRLTAGRYFCRLCVSCMPDGGVPFDPDASTAPATAVHEGMVALTDRDALVRQIAPVQGGERRWMEEATRSALVRLRISVPVFDDAGKPLTPDEQAAKAAPVIARLGTKAVKEAFTAASTGTPLTDGQAAWLSVLLPAMPVRDYAWLHTDASDGHAQLWTDLTRRSAPGLAAGPASLLAYSALLRGNGGLANIALQRALDADPGYSMARLLLGAIDSGLPMNVIRDAVALGVEHDISEQTAGGDDGVPV